MDDQDTSTVAFRDRPQVRDVPAPACPVAHHACAVGLMEHSSPFISESDVKITSVQTPGPVTLAVVCAVSYGWMLSPLLGSEASTIVKVYTFQVPLQEAGSSSQQPASPQCVISGLNSQDVYCPSQAVPGSPARDWERQTALPRPSALPQSGRELPAAGPATLAPSSPYHMLQTLLRPQGHGPGSGSGLGLMPRGSKLAQALGRAADPFAVIEASAILLCASELQEELAAFIPEASAAQRLLPPVCTLPASHPDAPSPDTQRPRTPAGSRGLPGCEAPVSGAAPGAQQSSEVQGSLLRDFSDLFGSPDCLHPGSRRTASHCNSELWRAAAAGAGPRAAQGRAAAEGAALGCNPPVTWEALEAQTQELLSASVGHPVATSPAFVRCAGGAMRTRTLHPGAGAAAGALASAGPRGGLPGCRAQGGAGVCATSLRPGDSPTVGLAALRIKASPRRTPCAAVVRRRLSPGPGQQQALGTSPLPAGASARGRARLRPATLGNFEVWLILGVSLLLRLGGLQLRPYALLCGTVRTWFCKLPAWGWAQAIEEK